MNMVLARVGVKSRRRATGLLERTGVAPATECVVPIRRSRWDTEAGRSNGAARRTLLLWKSNDNAHSEPTSGAASSVPTACRGRGRPNDSTMGTSRLTRCYDSLVLTSRRARDSRS